MHLKQIFLGGSLIAALLLSGCTVLSVAGAAVSVGVAAGSLAVGAVSTAASGAVAVGSAVVGSDDEDDD